jgi:YcaO-like protein with predicted kinase domain
MRAEGRTLVNLERSTRCRMGLIGRADELLWVEGYDHCSRRDVAVPWSLVGADYRIDPPGFHRAFQVSTDGLASGRTYCEAIFHGLCELIERDASALLELSSASAFTERTWRIDQHDPPEIRELDRRVRTADCSLSVTDMTTDLGVPSFTAVISDSTLPDGTQRARYGHSGGCGCHPDPRRALARAITEAAQSRLTRITGSRDDLPLGIFQAATTEDDPYGRMLALLGDQGEKRRNIAPFATGESIPANIRNLVSRLQAAGLNQVISVPMCNTFGIAVVRVIVPGLQTELDDTSGSLGVRALAVLLKGLQ